MVVTLDAELEAALAELARRQAVPPEVLVLEALRERFLGGKQPLRPQDEWERKLLALATDCGVSLPNAAFRRETLYD